MVRTGSTHTAILIKYLKYRLAARGRRGRGIHSPLVYDLIRKVIVNEERWKVPGRVVEVHRALLKDRTRLAFEEFGAGSRVASTESGGDSRDDFTGSDAGSGITSVASRSIRSLTRRSSVNRRFGRFLFRLVRWFRPDELIELGTGIGVSTLYLSAAFDRQMESVEASPQKHAFSKVLFEQYGIKNVKTHCGTFMQCFEDVVPDPDARSMVFLDGDHRYGATMELVERLIDTRKNGEMLIVIDDIHWSEEMERAWNELRHDSRIPFTVDLFQVGLVFIRDEVSKQHFTLTF